MNNCLLNIHQNHPYFSFIIIILIQTFAVLILDYELMVNLQLIIILHHIYLSQ